MPNRTIHRSIEGFGVHDVIVETRDHAQPMALMSDAHVARSEGPAFAPGKPQVLRLRFATPQNDNSRMA